MAIDKNPQLVQPYYVTRPYCYPEHVAINAISEEDAIAQAHQDFGFCSNTTAELRTDRGIILIGN